MLIFTDKSLQVSNILVFFCRILKMWSASNTAAMLFDDGVGMATYDKSFV